VQRIPSAAFWSLIFACAFLRARSSYIAGIETL
jgi:hypothetical protein